MKRLLVLLTILTLPASIGFAHIEETWSQCDARYGKAMREGALSARYMKDGITIEITFDDWRDTRHEASDAAAANRGMVKHGQYTTGRAVDVLYTKSDNGAYFSESEVKALLNANTSTAGHAPDAGAWQPVKRTHRHEDYLRFDNKAKARVYWEYIDGANVTKRVEVKLIDQSTAARAQKSGEQLDSIEKDF